MYCLRDCKGDPRKLARRGRMNDTRRPAWQRGAYKLNSNRDLLAAWSSVGFGKEIPHYKSKGAGTCNRSPDQRLTIPRTVVIRPAHVRLESTARFAVMNVSMLRPLRREPDAHATMPDVRIVTHKAVQAGELSTLWGDANFESTNTSDITHSVNGLCQRR